MDIVRLTLGDQETKIRIDNILPDEIKDRVEVGWFEDNEPSTLKDIAIIMYRLVGCGVMWQLADELSQRLNLHNPAGVLQILEYMFKEFNDMPDEEAFKKYDDSPRLYDPLT